MWIYFCAILSIYRATSHSTLFVSVPTYFALVHTWGILPLGMRIEAHVPSPRVGGMFSRLHDIFSATKFAMASFPILFCSSVLFFWSPMFLTKLALSGAHWVIISSWGDFQVMFYFAICLIYFLQQWFSDIQIIKKGESFTCIGIGKAYSIKHMLTHAIKVCLINFWECFCDIYSVTYCVMFIYSLGNLYCLFGKNIVFLYSIPKQVLWEPPY